MSNPSNSQQTSTEERQRLRKSMRRLRNSLSPQQQAYAANKLCLQLSKNHAIRSAQTIATYLPNDGEISTLPFIQWAQSMGKTILLPVLHPIKKGQLWFVEYQPDCKLKTNRYGIVEPDPRFNQIKPVWAIDTVLLPLVAFDRFGGRLGMGGGYYDRTFANRQKVQPFHKPRLIGLAHQLQEVEQLSIASWDIPLSAIATDDKIIDC